MYSKYEDLVNISPNPDYICKLVSQWLFTDLVNERRGAYVPLSEPILCTYEQMDKLGRNNISLW